jgi:tryptophan-rich sensory protein
MKNKYSRGLIIGTLIAGVLASVLQLFDGGKHLFDGIVWGIFLVMVGNTLILVLGTKPVEQAKQIITVLALRSVARISILTVIFLTLLFVLKINEVGFIVGIVLSVILSGIVAFVSLRLSDITKENQ